MICYNLTQHFVSPEQQAAGIVDLPQNQKLALRRELTFNTLPTRGEIECRCHAIIELLPSNCSSVMVGGAPYLLDILVPTLLRRGIVPFAAFTLRVSSETPDGRKVSIFRHEGLVQLGEESVRTCNCGSGSDYCG